MGLFDTVKGALDSAVTAAENKFKQEIDSLLVPGEQVEGTMRLVEDYIAITNKRVILIDKKYVGSSRAIISIPHSKITEVAMTTGGFMKFSQELVIQVGSTRHDFKVFDPKQTVEIYKAIVSKMT